MNNRYELVVSLRDISGQGVSVGVAANNRMVSKVFTDSKTVDVDKLSKLLNVAAHRIAHDWERRQNPLLTIQE